MKTLGTQDMMDMIGDTSTNRSWNSAFETAEKKGASNIASYVFCDYEIRNYKKTSKEQLTRRNLASITFNGKDVCGDCHDGLSECLEGESSPDITYVVF